MGEESKLVAGEGFIRKRRSEESEQKCPSWYVEPLLEIRHKARKKKKPSCDPGLVCFRGIERDRERKRET